MTIAITGTTRGIGAALAKSMRLSGEVVISLGRGANCTYVDLESVNSINALEEKLHNIPIDLLVCNAGVFLDKEEDIYSGYDVELWNKTFFINVTSVFLLIQKTLPNIKAAKGKIAIIASQMGSQHMASGDNYIYRASKSAVLSLGRNLAKDLTAEGIPVGIYHPGWVKTEMGGIQADISVETSTNGLISCFNRLSLKNTGCFETWDGKSHPF